MSQILQFVQNTSLVVDHLTGNSGGQVGPDGTGNINIVGGTTGLTFVGTPLTHTLTLSGTLAIANGGTNATSMTNTYGVNYFDGTRIVTTTVGTTGQVLTSNGAGVAPTFQAPLPGYLTYEEITAATKTIVNNYEYGANRGGGVAFALPATAAVGTRFAITGISGLWSLTQAANQYVGFGSSTTTIGVGGSLTATNAGDCITCTCIVANLGWRVTSSVGNITIV